MHSTLPLCPDCWCAGKVDLVWMGMRRCCGWLGTWTLVWAGAFPHNLVTVWLSEGLPHLRNNFSSRPHDHFVFEGFNFVVVVWKAGLSRVPPPHSHRWSIKRLPEEIWFWLEIAFKTSPHGGRQKDFYRRFSSLLPGTVVLWTRLSDPSAGKIASHTPCSICVTVFQLTGSQHSKKVLSAGLQQCQELRTTTYW